MFRVLFVCNSPLGLFPQNLPEIFFPLDPMDVVGNVVAKFPAALSTIIFTEVGPSQNATAASLSSIVFANGSR